MRTIIKNTIIICTVLFINSCTERILGPGPGNSPTELFEQLWNDYDQHYANFIAKCINWDSLYIEYSGRISDETGNRELFDLMAELISHLTDAHAIFESDFDLYAYNKYVLSDFNLNLVKQNYLKSYHNSSVMTYGQLESEIGYIHISTFYHPDKSVFTYIDQVLNTLNASQGLVMDIRQSQGGDTECAKILASRFTDIDRIYMTFQYRNGPDHNDFSEITYGYIRPAPDKNYPDNIILLIDNTDGSAAEDFTCMMDVLPHVTTVGTTTMGSAGGCPVTRELTNGWKYRMASCVERTADGDYIEDHGIIPDITIEFTQEDIIHDIDPQLETAMELLLN